MRHRLHFIHHRQFTHTKPFVKLIECVKLKPNNADGGAKATVTLFATTFCFVLP